MKPSRIMLVFTIYIKTTINCICIATLSCKKYHKMKLNRWFKNSYGCIHEKPLYYLTIK